MCVSDNVCVPHTQTTCVCVPVWQCVCACLCVSLYVCLCLCLCVPVTVDRAVKFNGRGTPANDIMADLCVCA
jgi:hypothetical protein